MLQELTADTPACRVFWATVGCIAANIIARVQNHRPVGTGLIGAGAAAIGAATAKAFGCAEVAVPTRGWSAAEVFHTIQDAGDRHHWPVRLRFPGGMVRKRMFCWFTGPEDRNVIMDLDPYLADATGLQTRWRFVRWDDPLPVPSAIAEHGPNLLVHWLQHLLRQYSQPASRKRSLAAQVIEDFAAWIGDRGWLGPVVVGVARPWRRRCRPSRRRRRSNHTTAARRCGCRPTAVVPTWLVASTVR